jgi:hypothetical protein
MTDDRFASEQEERNAANKSAAWKLLRGYGRLIRYALFLLALAYAYACGAYHP